MYFKTNGTKKILVIVPHQDDEINLMGGFLPLLTASGVDVYILYTTDGAMFYPASIRYKEAKKATSTLGVNPNNLIFMGFPDGQTQKYRHDIATKIKRHILDLKPQVIFAVDLDQHSDHKITHNAFLEALSDIKASCPEYTPTIYKGFAYSMAYETYKDYYNYNLLSVQKPGKEELAADTATELDNPEYHWDERVRLPIDLRATAIPLKHNLLFKAICCHKSQLLRIKSYNIINGDAVFWHTSGKPAFQVGIITINNNFVYDRFFLTSEEELHVNFYTYNISQELQLMINGHPADSSPICLKSADIKNNIQTVTLVDKNNRQHIYDKIEIVKLSVPTRILQKISWIFDRMNNYLHYKLYKTFKAKLN